MQVTAADKDISWLPGGVGAKVGDFKTIYLIRCRRYHKIGHTWNVKARISNYNVHNPYPIELVCQAYTPYYMAFEVWMLLEYGDKWHRGEWFKLDRLDIERVRSVWFDGVDSK